MFSRVTQNDMEGHFWPVGLEFDCRDFKPSIAKMLTIHHNYVVLKIRFLKRF